MITSYIGKRVTIEINIACADWKYHGETIAKHTKKMRRYWDRIQKRVGNEANRWSYNNADMVYDKFMIAIYWIGTGDYHYE